MTSAAEAEVLRADDRRFEAIRYLAVYAKTGEHWRMLAWQSTRVPDA